MKKSEYINPQKFMNEQFIFDNINPTHEAARRLKRKSKKKCPKLISQR